MTAQIIPFPPPKASLVKDVTVEGEVLEGKVVSKPKGYEFTPAMANRFFHHGDAAPVAAAPKPKKRRKRSAKTRVEQIDMTCARVAHKRHEDLRGLPGLLTIDFKNDKPHEVTFDPDDESIKNVVVPVIGYKRLGRRIEITSDEGKWTWTLKGDAK